MLESKSQNKTSVFNYSDHATAIDSLKPNKKRKLDEILTASDKSFGANEENKNDGTSGYYYIKSKSR